MFHSTTFILHKFLSLVSLFLFSLMFLCLLCTRVSWCNMYKNCLQTLILDLSVIKIILSFKLWIDYEILRGLKIVRFYSCLKIMTYLLSFEVFQYFTLWILLIFSYELIFSHFMNDFNLFLWKILNITFAWGVRVYKLSLWALHEIT